MIGRMLGFVKVVIATTVIGVILGNLAQALGADLESPWILVVLTVSMILGSLFDKEGFWGEPHPFRRHVR